MKTLALRYSDNYAPSDGTIGEHEKLINKNGFVWYGKFGNKVSQQVINDVLEKGTAKVLFIKSGREDIYYANVDKIQYNMPEEKYIPKYYSDSYDRVSVWFRITEFKKTDYDVVKDYYVISSDKRLDIASKHSMNSCFIVEKR